jgi:hypothetical protein
MRKFAPMGSAVCFPLECIVFAIICEASVRHQSGRRSRKYDYVVYGDDIVIRAEYYDTAIEILSQLGFAVNSTKSFGDRYPDVVPFREACGIEALGGKDITPLRISRRMPSVTDNDSDHQAGLGVGLVDFYNRVFLRGFDTLRRWLNDVLIRHRWFRTIVRVSLSDYQAFEKSIALGARPWIFVATPFVIVPDGTDTQWRAYGSRSDYPTGLQRLQGLVTVAVPRRRPMHHDSNDYYSWCLQQVNDPVADDTFVIDDTGIVTIRPRDLKWSKAWVILQRKAQPNLLSPRR